MKRILLCALLAFSSVGMAAQASMPTGAIEKPAGRDTFFGVKAGASLTTVTNFDKFVDPGFERWKQEAKAGFYAGVFLEYRATNLIAIQPEVVYSRQGCRLPIDDGTNDGEATMNLDYVTIPITIKLFFSNVVSLDVGIYQAFLLGSEVKIKGLPSGLDLIAHNLDKHEFAVFDFGFLAGVSCKVAPKVDVSLRGTMGLVDAYAQDGVLHGDGRVTSPSKGGNFTLQLGAGYRF